MTPTPIIELRIASEGWLPEDTLRQLAVSAVGAVIQTAPLEIPANAELSLLFTDDKTIRNLNQRFRGVDKPTNVLSFPDRSMPLDPAGGAPIGDIVFALQTIKKEATLEGKNVEHHLSHLIIHGFLHLFDYDHQDDCQANEMETLEKTALARLCIKNPYGHDD